MCLGIFNFDLKAASDFQIITLVTARWPELYELVQRLHNAM
jgi:hypothetical protein